MYAFEIFVLHATAICNIYHSWLRSSSIHEPSDPLLRVHPTETLFTYGDLSLTETLCSPTEILLQLLLGSSYYDYNDFHQRSSTLKGDQNGLDSAFLETAQSRTAMGGVYKGQGRN
ncbi:unnamed protein product [Acanthocheilonema viteae]|uniref:Uncharacterized protein n=1 Tax=Acanthocheilonema viteae TaxID=6277 RepID=A0A498SHX5_ACAVI|nr:unnamed protein product [Acanthocheilonema viteae]